jgi:antitoxin (DNA-binding transcriptional repressor) of toxin-antitoxin stability system
MARVTATEAARTFSDILNRAAAGEEIEIVRNGATVAVVGPPKARFVSAESFRELMAALPPVDDDFAGDLAAIRRAAGPAENPWPS